MGPLAATALLAAPALAGAQGWSYPSFQLPRIGARDFTFGVAAAGDAGTSLVAQWREAIDARSLFSIEGGFADPRGGADARVLIGAGYGYKIADARADQPLDYLITGGAYGAFGGGTSLVRIPIGVSIGHRFPLEQGLAITPYVHPRVSLDFFRFDAPAGFDDSDSQIGIDFDLGASLEITREIALRASAVFSGSDTGRGSGNGFGLALTWTPPGLSRFTR